MISGITTITTISNTIIISSTISNTMISNPRPACAAPSRC